MIIGFKVVNPIIDAERINHWRSLPRISNVSRTSFKNMNKQQEEYLLSKTKDPNWVHWVISANNKKIGYINFSQTPDNTLTITWGFYVGDPEYLGFGAIIAASFYNLIFSKTNILTIQAEVLGHNPSVHAMHIKMGYKLFNVYKHIETHNMHSTSESVLLLEKGTWCNPKNALIKVPYEVQIPSQNNLWDKIKLHE